MGFQQGYTLRPPRSEDGPGLLAMMNEEELALTGRTVTSLDWLVAPWSAPGAELDRDHAVVCDADGGLAGYLMLDAHPPYGEVFAVGAVALGHHSRGIGAAVVEEIERRARGLAELAPAGGQVLLHLGALAGEPRVSGLLTAHGFDEVRRFWSMMMLFDKPMEAPAPLAGFELRPLGEGEEVAVYRCLAEAFQDHWGGDFEPEQRWLHRHVHGAESFAPDLWRVAWRDRAVAGALVATVSSDEDPTLGTIDLLGVRRDARGCGLGEALLRSGLAGLRERGCRGATLVVDSESLTGATRLYERVGMTGEPRYSTWEKRLRPTVQVAWTRA